MLRVLVDADNVAPRRLQPVLDLLALVSSGIRLTASGRPAALRRLRWPAEAELIESTGWQHADASLAAAYLPSRDPLVVVSGDGDFALLAERHPAPVLVISGAASMRLRNQAAVLDPAADGLTPLSDWLRAHGVSLASASG